MEQIAYNSSSKIGEHILVVIDKSTHEEHLCQPLQTNNKQFEIAVNFLSGYNGTFNVTNTNNKFYFEKPIKNEDCIRITIQAGAYEIESLDNEIKKQLLLKKVITLKLIIRSESNQILVP